MLTGHACAAAVAEVDVAAAVAAVEQLRFVGLVERWHASVRWHIFCWFTGCPA